MAHYYLKNVTKINTVTGSTTNYPMPADATNPLGIAFDGANMWTANYGSSNVSKL